MPGNVFRRLRRALGNALLWAPLGGLLVDGLGFIWIRSYDPLAHSMALGGLGQPGPGGAWQILSPGGEQLQVLTVPPGFQPIHVTEHWVVGIARDDLGVESARVHALLRH